ncbi:MAG: hypothetical protein HC902_01420 [Calothrix sp. SM1_5_4]|nr:hypothetical protein [Calothrix sp. SM1_5_4]
MLAAGIEQYYYQTHEKNKPEVLCKLIDAAEEFYGVVFCQTKNLVVDLTRYLTERGYKTECLHGDMSQSAREAAMLAFRQRRARILVCTDVASRGSGRKRHHPCRELLPAAGTRQLRTPDRPDRA